MDNAPKHTLINTYYSVTRTSTATTLDYPDLPLGYLGIVIDDYKHTMPTGKQGTGVLVDINRYTSLGELITDISRTYLPPTLKPENYGTSWLLCEHLSWFNRIAIGWGTFIYLSTGQYSQKLEELNAINPATYGLVPGTRWIIVDPLDIHSVAILCKDPRLQVVINDYPQLIYTLQKYKFIQVEVPNRALPFQPTMPYIYIWNGRFMKSDLQNKVVVQIDDQSELYEQFIIPLYTPP